MNMHVRHLMGCEKHGTRKQLNKGLCCRFSLIPCQGNFHPPARALPLHLSILLPLSLSLSHPCTPLSSGIRTTGNNVRSFTRSDSLFTYPALTRRDVLVGWSESRWAETPDSHLRHFYSLTPSARNSSLLSCAHTRAARARELPLSH